MSNTFNLDPDAAQVFWSPFRNCWIIRLFILPARLRDVDYHSENKPTLHDIQKLYPTVTRIV